MSKLGACASVATAAALVLTSPASAEGPDPHMPNGGAMWCQGGMGNVAMIPYCDGTKYPDGSFWHQTASSPFGFGGPASLLWNQPELAKP